MGAAKEENLDKLVSKFSQKYKLNPTLVKILVDEAVIKVEDSKGSTKDIVRSRLDSGLVNKAVAAGNLKELPDLSTLSGNVEAMSAHLATLRDSKSIGTSEALLSEGVLSLNLGKKGDTTLSGTKLDSKDSADIDTRRALFKFRNDQEQKSRFDDKLNPGAYDNQITDQQFSGSQGQGGDSASSASSGSATNQDYSRLGGFDQDEYTKGVDRLGIFSKSESELNAYQAGIDKANKESQIQQSKIDKRNSGLEAQAPDFDKVYQDEVDAVKQTAASTVKASDKYKTGLKNNQDLREEAFDATFSKSGLDARDPKNNRRVNATLAQQSRLHDSVMRGNAAAQDLSEAEIGSRKWFGRLLFGNIYEQGAKDTANRGTRLNKSFKDLIDTNEQAFDIALLKTVPDSTLNSAYLATLDSIKANNTAKVAQATSGLKAFKDKAGLIKLLNSNDAQKTDSTLRSLDLQLKGVNAGLTVAQLKQQGIERADKIVADAKRQQRVEAREARTIKREEKSDAAAEARDRRQDARHRQTMDQGKNSIIIQEQNISKAKKQATFDQNSGKYDPELARENYKVRLAKTKVDSVTLEETLDLLTDPQIRAARLRNKRATEMNAPVKEQAALAEANRAILVAEAIVNSYKDGTVTKQQELRLVKIQSEMASLKKLEEKMSDPEYQKGLDEAAKLKQQAAVAQSKNIIELERAKAASGYTASKVASEVDKMVEAKEGLVKNKKLMVQAEDAYTVLSLTENPIPAAIIENAKMSAALLQLGNTGALDVNPYVAAEFVAKMLPESGKLDTKETTQFLSDMVGKLTPRGIDVKTNFIDSKRALNEFISPKKGRLHLYSNKSSGISALPKASIMQDFVHQRKDGLSAYFDDPELIKNWDKSVNGFDRLQAIFTTLSKDKVDAFTMASSMYEIMNAGMDANNARKRFEIFGLDKQKHIRVKVPAIDIGDAVTNRGRLAVSQDKSFIAKGYIELTSVDDLVALLNKQIFKKK